MFVQAIFAHFGLQNRLFEQNATERQKRRDWLAEKIGFELGLRFARRLRFIGRQTAYFAYLQETESAKPEVLQHTFPSCLLKHFYPSKKVEFAAVARYFQLAT